MRQRLPCVLCEGKYLRLSQPNRVLDTTRKAMHLAPYLELMADTDEMVDLIGRIRSHSISVDVWKH